MTVFRGSCVALVTPFKNNKVDFDALGRLFEFHKQAQTDAILVLGTTGESCCITETERRKIISFSRKNIDKNIKLIVGTGSNCTETAIRNSKEAERLGADAILVVTPYYNKCTQDGAYNHYKRISESVRLPIILYNVPSRTGFNLLPKTVQKLSKLENISGIKEANGDINQIQELFYLCSDKIDIYSGNDNLNHIFSFLGAKGAISVVANILPREIRRQFDGKKDPGLGFLLQGLSNACFIEPNPIPIKFLLAKEKLIENELRSPLTFLSPEHERIVYEIYQNTVKDIKVKYGL